MNTHTEGCSVVLANERTGALGSAGQWSCDVSPGCNFMLATLKKKSKKKSVTLM